jgi:signal transduction histidine kinase
MRVTQLSAHITELTGAEEEVQKSTAKIPDLNSNARKKRYMDIKLPTFSKKTSVIFALVSLCLIGYVDYITGHEFSLSAFYLLPISIVALNFSRPIGISAAAISAIVETTANILGGGFYYSRPLFHFWNMAILMAIYIVIATLVSLLRDAYDKEREKAVELAHSNADLKAFAHVVSHDLKEPLRVITGFLALLEKRYKDKLDKDGMEYIKFTVDSAKRMDELIKDILEYSQVGTKDKEFKPVDCLSVLSKAIFNLQVAIQESGATVTHDNLPTVMADSTLLASLFQNLLGNAIKFHGDEAPKVHISAKRKEDEWVFSVCDNGIGIDPQFQEQIFTAFRRLHTRDEYPGTGIGLATCKKIIEYHGGRLWVKSETGIGSTFYFTIPDRHLALL